jgi:hypothetical protein
MLGSIYSAKLLSTAVVSGDVKNRSFQHHVLNDPRFHPATCPADTGGPNHVKLNTLFHLLQKIGISGFIYFYPHTSL